jgi:general secretion pathway protein G
VDLRRVLFFFEPRAEHLYDEFRDRAGKRFPCALPERIGKAQFLYLEQADGRWTARTITLRVPKLNFMGNSAIEEMLLKGLGPIFARLGLPVPRHSFPLSYKFAIACAVLVGLQTGAAWRLDVDLQSARRQLAMSKLHSISSALEQYYLNAGAYPTEAQGLTVLVEGGLLPDSDLLDPWGGPVGYSLSQANGEPRFELVSLGADGVEGGEGSRADIKLSR